MANKTCLIGKLYMSDKGEIHHEIMLCKDDKIVSDPEIEESMFNYYFTTVTDRIGITEDKCYINH